MRAGLPVLCCLALFAALSPTPGAGVQGKPDAQEELIIDRLIEMIKDTSASKDQRANACQMLGKRGPKAKRGVPEMVKFLQEMIEKDKSTSTGEYLGGTSVRVVKVLEGLATFGADAKEAVPLLAKVFTQGIPDPNSNSVPTKRPAAEGLGKIGSPEAFAILVKASTNSSSELRIAAVQGLAYFAHGSDADLKLKAVAELTVIAETDTSSAVQKVARELLQPPMNLNTLQVAADGVELKASAKADAKAGIKIVRGAGDKVKDREVEVTFKLPSGSGLRLEKDKITIPKDKDSAEVRVFVEDAAKFVNDVEITVTAQTGDVAVDAKLFVKYAK
jgi:hypothetical protein